MGRTQSKSARVNRGASGRGAEAEDQEGSGDGGAGCGPSGGVGQLLTRRRSPGGHRELVQRSAGAQLGFRANSRKRPVQ